MTHSLKEVVKKHGYAFVPEYCPGSDIVAVANALGQPLTPWKGGLVQDLVPRATSTPNTYSGIYGLERFPFHTDLAHWRIPPRYLLLRCVIGSAEVPTLLLHVQSILDAVTLDILARAIFRPRRPREGGLPLLRLYEPTEDGYCFRWDDVFVTPASRIGDLARRQVSEQLLKSDPQSIALIRSGDTLLVDNWRMLHARSPIPAGLEERRIQRVYLEHLH